MKSFKQFLIERPEQIESPEFKAWFGNSKVVDSRGRPQVVYHGTLHDFAEFHPSDGYNNLLSGIYAAPTESAAREYAQDDTGRREGRVLPLFMSIKHPARPADLEAVSAELEVKLGREPTGLENTEALVKRGFDGYIDHGEIVAFRANQIKSATDNSGRFDATDNIYAMGAEQ
jgi:hypothetical protein